MRGQDIYIEYFSIKKQNFSYRVKYFEDHERDLEYIDLDLKIEMKIDYLISLFEIGRYDRFTGKVDEILEAVIEHNIFEYDGVKIFEKLLFLKACSYVQLRTWDKAQHVLISLMKMKSDNKAIDLLYYKCRKKSLGNKLSIYSGLASVMLMCSLSLQFASLFVIEAFHDQYIYQVSMMTGIFGIFALLFFCYYWYSIRYEVKKEIKYFTSGQTPYST